MGRYNRKCILCGKEYKYCDNCKDYDRVEPWHNIYCSENCRTIFNTAVDYAQKNMTKQQAQEILSSCDLSNKENFKADILAVIDDIFVVDEIVEDSEKEPKKEERQKPRPIKKR